MRCFHRALLGLTLTLASSLIFVRCPWAAGSASSAGQKGLPVNTQLQAFYNVEKPQDGADWTVRFQLQVLLPKYAGENRRYRQGVEE